MNVTTLHFLGKDKLKAMVSKALREHVAKCTKCTGLPKAFLQPINSNPRRRNAVRYYDTGIQAIQKFRNNKWSTAPDTVAKRKRAEQRRSSTTNYTELEKRVREQ